jgi:hypothetical protein
VYRSGFDLDVALAMRPAGKWRRSVNPSIEAYCWDIDHSRALLELAYNLAA